MVCHCGCHRACAVSSWKRAHDTKLSQDVSLRALITTHGLRWWTNGLVGGLVGWLVGGRASGCRWGDDGPSLEPPRPDYTRPGQHPVCRNRPLVARPPPPAPAALMFSPPWRSFGCARGEERRARRWRKRKRRKMWAWVRWAGEGAGGV
jgi:hypothetical protein